MRTVLKIILLNLLSLKAFALKSQVFISSSMPNTLVAEILQEAAELKIPVNLNGLIDNSMPKTMQWVYEFSQKIPNLNLQIDPVAFKDFSYSRLN